jgi:hypothetical protein
MDKQERYEATEKGKEARARAQATRQKKRDALKKVRRVHESRRRVLGSAKFSKQYTVHSIVVKGRRGLQLSFKKRYSVESEIPQCVQGGVPRWSESILNPAYRKQLTKEKAMTAFERDEVKISQAKVSAVNCVQEWIQKLVNLGASPNEINDTLEKIKRMAIISLGQRKEK